MSLLIEPKDLIVVSKVPNFLKPNERDISYIYSKNKITVNDLIREKCDDLKKMGATDFVVTVNGQIITNFNYEIKQGDFVNLTVRHGFIALAGYAWLALVAMEVSTVVANVLCYVIAGALIIGAGLLVTSFLSHPNTVPNSQQSEGNDSPSYAFQASNPVLSGTPVATVYGEVSQLPQVLTSYRTVASDYNMWQWVLLGFYFGATNNDVGDYNVYLGEEKLTNYTNYSWAYSSGSIVPTNNDLNLLQTYNFNKTYHDRSFDRILKFNGIVNPTRVITTLLNFSSSPIVNEGTPGDTWNLMNGANIVIDGEAGFLNLPANSYIEDTSGNCLMGSLNGEWEMEFYASFTNQDSRGLFLISSVWYTGNFYLTMHYANGMLYLQAFSSVGEFNNITSWNLHLNMSVTVTLPINTWTYFRVLRCIGSSGIMTVHIFMEIDGALTLLATNSDNYIPNYYNFSLSECFGKGLHMGLTEFVDLYDPTTFFTPLYGNCNFNSVRITTNGTIHSYSDLSIPAYEFELPEVDLSGLYYIQTKSSCNVVRLLIQFPQGCFTTSNNKLTETTVAFTFYYKRLTGDQTVYTDTSFSITIKRNAAFNVEHVITFPDMDYWELAIERNTSDDSSDDTQQRTQTVLIGIVEIVNIAQSYPGLKLGFLSIQSSEKMSGQMPPIKVFHERTAITVPSWDGLSTMVVNPQNPMWAAYDMFTNIYTGRGISPTELLQSAWIEWYDYCNGLVDGNYRCRCNVVLDTNASFSDQLKAVEEVGRAKIFRLGNLWYPTIDKPRTESYLFSVGNMVEGSFHWESYEESEKVDGVVISFSDKAKYYNTNRVMAKASWYETLDRIPNVATIELKACNNYDEANRYAIFTMQKTELLTRHGTLTAFFDAVFLEIGDVITIIHPTNIASFGGRLYIDHSATSVIKLDQIINMPSSIYTYGGGNAEVRTHFFCIDPDGTYCKYDILGPFDEDTQTILIDGIYTGYALDTFGIGRDNDEKLYYQIINKKLIPPTDDKDPTIEFDFIEYVDSRFYHSSYGNGAVVI